MALNSKTTLKIIDALCEGPIEGLVEVRKGGKKSVFLNETIVTGKQFTDQTVKILTKEGTATQGAFEEGSTFEDQQTTIINVNREIGSSYSEELTADNKVKRRNYGKGQVTQAIAQTDIDFVELVFTIPKLFCVAEEGLARGQLFFAQIKLELHICGTDGVWNPVNIHVESQERKNIIKGICTSSYQFKTQTIDLTKNKYGKGPYKIRVRKIEFNEPEDAFEISFRDFEDVPKKTPIASKRADQILLTSIIVGKKFGTAYPHTALVSLSLDAEEYSTLPARAYDIKGLKVKIPSNASVEKSGRLNFDNKPFDGSLQENEAWTTCPVCCFYDLLTNKRYGSGDFIDESNLNWVDLIEIAKYCNEEVEYIDDQLEVQKEARFAINTVIGSQAEAFSVLQDMASVFRGMLFWKSDNVQVAADHGELDGGHVPAIHAFSNSNVVNGSFSYSGSSLKTRSTRVRVRYNDPDNFHKPNFICIEDRSLVEKYGVQEKSVVAFGCTSKYQAQRMGRWIMQSEKLHDETVTFSVGLEGLNVLPGQVFEVSDEMRTGVRFAGRILGATTSLVRIDYQPVLFDNRTGNIDTWSVFDNEDVGLPSASNNKISVVMKDGTIETSSITSVAGNTLNVSPEFTQAPPDDALYAIKSNDLVLPKYRCLSIAEGEDGTYAVVGVKHVDGIYTVVEDPSAKLELAPPFFYGSEPDAPTDVKITFQQIDDGRNTTNRATVSWTRGLSGSVIEFKVRYKVGDGGNWINQFTNNNSIDISTGLVPGKLLIVDVKAVGPAPDRKESDYTRQTREIPVGGTSDDSSDLAQVTLPPDPENVTIEAIGVDQVALRWGATASGQKLEGFIAVIKHSSKTDGSGSWANSSILRKVEARTTSVVLPLLNGEYLIKFQNEQRLRSANAVSAIINIPDGIPRLNFEVIREDQLANEFGGDKVGVYYNQEYDGLILDGDASFDAISSLDGFTANIDSHFGTQLTRGEYFFQKTVDFGGKYSVRLQRVLTTRGLYASDLIDDRSELIDTWSDFDGDVPDDTNVQVYFRKSDLAATVSDFVAEDGTDRILYEDNSNIEQNSDLAFDDWIPLENNAYVGRTFQFKAVLTTDHVDQTPIVDQLGVTLQLERRTENSGTITSGASSKAVAFVDDFYTDADTKVAVGITAFDMEAGDYFVLDPNTVTGSSFIITFKNGSTVISRDFQYTAIGYGTKQS
tara:strand:+ start:17663 stop:21265 length:3603 start_codon:yes stop_codon:yes gene_type:complete